MRLSFIMLLHVCHIRWSHLSRKVCYSFLFFERKEFRTTKGNPLGYTTPMSFLHRLKTHRVGLSYCMLTDKRSKQKLMVLEFSLSVNHKRIKSMDFYCYGRFHKTLELVYSFWCLTLIVTYFEHYTLIYTPW